MIYLVGGIDAGVDGTLEAYTSQTSKQQKERWCWTNGGR